MGDVFDVVCDVSNVSRWIPAELLLSVTGGVCKSQRF